MENERTGVPDKIKHYLSSDNKANKKQDIIVLRDTDYIYM